MQYTAQLATYAKCYTLVKQENDSVISSANIWREVENNDKDVPNPFRKIFIFHAIHSKT